jgi:hypothetical protein
MAEFLRGTPKYGYLPALLVSLAALWLLGIILALIIGDFSQTIPNNLYGSNVTSFSSLTGSQFWEFILVYFVGIVALFIGAILLLASDKVMLYFGALFSLGGYAYVYGAPIATYDFNWFAMPQVVVFGIAIVLIALSYILLIRDEWYH